MRHDELSEFDRKEIERFTIFCRLVGQAERAGLDHFEAMKKIYPDVYGECDLHDPGVYP